jgi:hypothetical protein
MQQALLPAVLKHLTTWRMTMAIMITMIMTTMITTMAPCTARWESRCSSLPASWWWNGWLAW